MGFKKDPTARVGKLLVQLVRQRSSGLNINPHPIFASGFVAAGWSASLARPNLGDSVARFLVSKLLEEQVVQVPLDMPGKLISVGSVMHHALPGDICWGTGTIREEFLDCEGTEILAVRGPRTARLIRHSDVPDVYGDPALLLPKLYTPKPRDKSRVTVVPHYVDFPQIKETWADDSSTRLVDVTRLNWRKAVDDIVNSEVVISSSLHGLIIAEAYGVPAVWVRISDKIGGGDHKFLDFYEASNRLGRPIDQLFPLRKAADFAVLPPEFDTTRLHGTLRAGLRTE